jgi:hypothetical protein
MAEQKLGYVTAAERDAYYKVQTGRKQLTPAQARRAAKKARQGKA